MKKKEFIRYNLTKNPDAVKKLVDSIKDSAHLFGDEWDPDDIVREIEADENFGIRILSPDEEIPDDYDEPWNGNFN